MKRFYVERIDGDDVEVILLPHKDNSGYSYVNLTKGHICPCKFDTEQAAIDDMMANNKVTGFYEI